VAKLIEELAGDDGAVEEVVTPEVTDLSTGDDEAGRQPREAEQGKPTKKPSLDDDPNFRKWKSEQDKKHAALQSALDRAERQRQGDAQRQAWYEQQLEQLQTQGLDEPSKLAFENNKLKRMLSALQQQKQIEEGRAKIFQRITNRFAEVGVPYEAYANAQDADEAWDLAADYALKNLPQRSAATAAARAEKRAANDVDLGGGASITPDDEWEAEAARLLKRKDSIGYARHILKQRFKE